MNVIESDQSSNSEPQLAPSPAPTNASYSIPDLEVLSVQIPPEYVSLVSHVVAWFPQAAEDQVGVAEVSP